ncbi:hypothetical protein [Nocardioides pakistanensis]
MRYLGGHLGAVVSPLLDGQLDPSSTERAWAHVHGCETCRRQVEREGWVKTRLSAMSHDEGAPPPELLGSLYSLCSAPPDGAAAWAAVAEIERRGRDRRRAGLAMVGVGSVSAAVLGLATLTGSTLGIGGAPGATPASSLSRSGAGTPASTTTAFVAPVTRVQGRLPSAARRGAGPAATATHAPSQSAGQPGPDAGR